MNLVRVLIINKQNKYQLNFDDDQLSSLSNMIKEPSEYGMVNYLDNKTVESLNTSNKYYISGDDKTKSYQLDILKNLLLNVNSLPMLPSIDNAFDKDGKLNYTLIGYLYEEDNGNQELFLYKLKKSNLVRNGGFFAFKKKSGALHSNAVKVEQIDNGFSLPTTDCLASIYKRKDSNEGKQYKAKIYKAYIFDNVFQTSETQHKYVERTIKKFETTTKITKDDKVAISFEKADLSNLKNVIYSDDHLTKTFAGYHDSGRRIIKQISLNKLNGVLKILQTHVKNNADAGFDLKKHPNIK